jgi:hypothetical protein
VTREAGDSRVCAACRQQERDCGAGRVYAIDPGPEVSHLIGYEPDTRQVFTALSLPSEALARELEWRAEDGKAILLVERVAAQGQAVSQHTFDTAEWVGRFVQAWRGAGGGTCRRIFRREVKLWILARASGTDAQIRAAVLDRFGGPKAKGTVRAKGPLYGLRADQFQALALAVTYAERLAEGLPAPGEEA